MATAAELQAQIAACRADFARAEGEREQAQQERELAEERQRLRRVLEHAQLMLSNKKEAVQHQRNMQNYIDRDILGPHFYAPEVGRDCVNPYPLPHGSTATSARSEKQTTIELHKTQRHMMNCNSDVLTGELEWSIKGMTWLADTLFQVEESYAESSTLRVGQHGFRLGYHPDTGSMGFHNQRASLAIIHAAQGPADGIAFRYKLTIKSESREYVQWGDDGHNCTSDDVDDFLFGPDVCSESEIPDGIFGLTHHQLIDSEWVVDDALTVKLHVSVRPLVEPKETTQNMEAVIDVPAPTLSDDLLALLGSGASSDVTFTVQGEDVHAHSAILSARSEVLQRQFACGMQESASKKVAIEDCDPMVFKAFLRYLYSDDFLAMEKFIKEEKTDSSSSTAESGLNGSLTTVVQQLLALSHKYQLSRLQLWCEVKLSANISVENVCTVLCQAHLYTAKNLERKCLDFIKQNVNEVFTTETYSSLTQMWPPVSLKITAHLANVPDEKTVKAIEVQQKTRKRKHDD